MSHYQKKSFFKELICYEKINERWTGDVTYSFIELKLFASSDDCIGEKLTITKHHWCCTYFILTWIYICSITDSEHFLFIYIANCITDIYIIYNIEVKVYWSTHNYLDKKTKKKIWILYKYLEYSSIISNWYLFRHIKKCTQQNTTSYEVV